MSKSQYQNAANLFSNNDFSSLAPEFAKNRYNISPYERNTTSAGRNVGTAEIFDYNNPTISTRPYSQFSNRLEEGGYYGHSEPRLMRYGLDQLITPNKGV